MTRALLTGAGGFVGSHMLDALLGQTDWDIVAVDSFRHNGSTDGLQAVLEAADDLALRRVVTLAHDLTVPFSPRQVGAIGRLDFLINVASRCSVDESIADPAGFVRNNVDSTLTVLELARQQWCYQGGDVRLPTHRLVHLSTDEVHGPTTLESALPTRSIHAPSSPYAASKAAQEDFVHAWHRTFGIPCTIVTSANMFGERQSMLAYIPRVIRAVLDGSQLQVHTWRGEPGRRRYTYAGNTAQAIVSHLTSRSVGHQLQRRILPGQAQVGNLELAEMVAGLLGRKLRYRLVDGPSTRPGYDPSYPALSDGEGWGLVSFIDGLERTVKWYVDNRDWLR